MSKEQDEFWTMKAIEKEKKMAYDAHSPQMNVEEPMKVPSNVFETLQELADVIGQIEHLTGRKEGLMRLYQKRMQEAEAGFHSLMNRPELAGPVEPDMNEGFGKPRFGF